MLQPSTHRARRACQHQQQNDAHHMEGKHAGHPHTSEAFLHLQFAWRLPPHPQNQLYLFIYQQFLNIMIWTARQQFYEATHFVRSKLNAFTSSSDSKGLQVCNILLCELCSIPIHCSRDIYIYILVLGIKGGFYRKRENIYICGHMELGYAVSTRTQKYTNITNDCSPGNAPPPPSLDAWVPKHEHDIYFIGFQVI